MPAVSELHVGGFLGFGGHKGIHVEGLPETQRAFKELDKDLSRELRATLKQAAEPVRATAQSMARSNTSEIGEDWSEMRTGVTAHLVYVAPARRGRNPNPMLRRPNLAGLLMDRAMSPALKVHLNDIERDVGKKLDHLFSEWEKM